MRTPKLISQSIVVNSLNLDETGNNDENEIEDTSILSDQLLLEERAKVHYGKMKNFEVEMQEAFEFKPLSRKNDGVSKYAPWVLALSTISVLSLVIYLKKRN